MDEIYLGSCQCGAVSFRIEGAFESFYLCHCSRCQKDTGSAHAANLFSRKAQLVWQSGQELVTRFMLAGTQHSKSFCSVCGAALPDLQADGALLVVPAGSLDTPVALRPTARICYADRADWVDGLEIVLTHDGLPG